MHLRIWTYYQLVKVFLCYPFYCFIVNICALHVLPRDHVQSGLKVTVTYCVVQIFVCLKVAPRQWHIAHYTMYKFIFTLHNNVCAEGCYQKKIPCTAVLNCEGLLIRYFQYFARRVDNPTLCFAACDSLPHTYLWVELQVQVRSWNTVYGVMQKNVVCICTATILIYLPESSHVVTLRG